MKRFFFISALFHGTLLLLLFSWEVPPANRVLSQKIVEVFLVENAEEKRENKGFTERKPAQLKLREKENPEPTPRTAPINSEESKKNQNQEKTETNQIEAKEERKQIEEKAPSEERFLMTKGEDPPMIQAKQPSQTGEGGNPKKFANPTENPQVSGAKGTAGTTFVASIGTVLEKGEIHIGEGIKGTGIGKEGGPGQLSNVQSPSQEGESILAKIISKIERAKRYPKAARKMHIEGKATVRFKITPDGKVDAVELVESSGSDILDQASLETVNQAIPLPYKEGWLKVGIVFKIL
jgi:TonB family protein